MKIKYNGVYVFLQIVVAIVYGYISIKFWGIGKADMNVLELPYKILIILLFLLFEIMMSRLITDALTQMYVYDWGMKILFLHYEKKVYWDDFSMIQRDEHRFLLNIIPQKVSCESWSICHPFNCFIVWDNSKMLARLMIPLSADEFCDLLTSYGVKYTESK